MGGPASLPCCPLPGASAGFSSSSADAKQWAERGARRVDSPCPAVAFSSFAGRSRLINLMLTTLSTAAAAATYYDGGRSLWGGVPAGAKGQQVL